MFTFKDFLSGKFTSSSKQETEEDKFNRLKFLLNKYYGMQYSIRKIKFIQINAKQVDKYRQGTVHISNNETFIMLAGYGNNDMYYAFSIDPSTNTIIPQSLNFPNKYFKPLENLNQIYNFLNAYRVEGIYALYHKPLSQHVISNAVEE